MDWVNPYVFNEIYNIGAHHSYSQKYNIANFQAKHVGDIIAKHVGEFDDTLGVILSNTGSGLCLFANAHSHIRAATITAHKENKALVKQTRIKMVNNVLVIPTEGRNDSLFCKRASALIDIFAGTDLSRIPADKLVQTIKIMTHRNCPDFQKLWIEEPASLLPDCRLYKRLTANQDATK